MCQLSLPAESFLSLPQTLAQPTDKKTVSFKPVSRTVSKMQYKSVILLGLLNAFALAVPLQQIRSPTPPEPLAPWDGIAGEEAALTGYGKRSPIPPAAAAAIASAEESASEAIAGGESAAAAGIASGEAAAAAGIATAEAAIEEYGKKNKRAPTIPPAAAAAIASAEESASEAIAGGESAAAAGIASGEAAAAAGIATAEAAIEEYGKKNKRAPTIPPDAAAAIASAEESASEAIAGGISSAEAGITSGEAAAAAGIAAGEAAIAEYGKKNKRAPIPPDAAAAIAAGEAAAAAGIANGEAAAAAGIAAAAAAAEEYGSGSVVA